MKPSSITTSGRRLIVLICGAAAILAATTSPILGENADVNEILRKMQRAMWPGQDMRAKFEVQVTSNLGEHAYVTGAYYRKAQPPDGTLQRFVIESPLELRGFEVAGETADGKPKSLHVYVPVVRRVREIQVDMRKESFLASDFNFEDLGFEDLTEQESKLLGEVEEDGRSLYQIESKPKGDWMYEKIVRLVDKKTSLPIRTDYHCWGVGLCKVRRTTRIDKIGPYDSPAVITMEDLIHQQTTQLTVQKAEFDVDLPTELFQRHGIKP